MVEKGPWDRREEGEQGGREWGVGIGESQLKYHFSFFCQIFFPFCLWMYVELESQAIFALFHSTPRASNPWSVHLSQQSSYYFYIHFFFSLVDVMANKATMHHPQVSRNTNPQSDHWWLCFRLSTQLSPFTEATLSHNSVNSFTILRPQAIYFS